MLFTAYINQVVEVQINQVEDQIKHLQDLLSNLQAQKQTLLSVEQQCESGINQLELAYDSVKTVCPEMMGTFKNRVLAIFDESAQIAASQESDPNPQPSPNQPVDPIDNSENNEDEEIKTVDAVVIDSQDSVSDENKDYLSYDELYAIDTQLLITIAESLNVTVEGNKTRKKLAIALTDKVTTNDYHDAVQKKANQAKGTKSIVKA